VGFYLFFARSRLGKAIRAAAQDPATAGLMGVNVNNVLAICFGLGAFMAGCRRPAGEHGLPNFHGSHGAEIYRHRHHRGRAGREWAASRAAWSAGFILGIVGSLVTTYQPALKPMIVFYGIFLLLLLVRPTGIFGKK
jgi:branched-chain amino acid transport system permease protein